MYIADADYCLEEESVGCDAQVQTFLVVGTKGRLWLLHELAK